MSGVIVTGGASGIGRASAEALLQDGRQVMLWDKTRDVTAVGESMGVPSAVVDVTAGALIASAAAAAAATMSGIDGLVHAAGMVTPEPVGAFTEQSWDAVLNVNLRAYALLSQILLPYLQEAARTGAQPSIVGISSIEALQANPFIPAYCASKAGLLGLIRSMAAQLGPDGIRVNAVCPGFIQTPMLQVALDIEEVRNRFIASTPLGRLGQPADIGASVAFLMSPRASFITGTHLVIDGGVTCKHP